MTFSAFCVVSMLFLYVATSHLQLAMLYVSQVAVFVGRPSFGSSLHEQLGGVCAICVFSQQVITNRSLTSHSVPLDSPVLAWSGPALGRSGMVTAGLSTL